MTVTVKLGLKKSLLAWFNMIFGMLAAIISVWAFFATLRDAESPTMLYVAGTVIGLVFAWMGYYKWCTRPRKLQQAPAATDAQATQPEIDSH